MRPVFRRLRVFFRPRRRRPIGPTDWVAAAFALLAMVTVHAVTIQPTGPEPEPAAEVDEASPPSLSLASTVPTTVNSKRDRRIVCRMRLHEDKSLLGGI